MVANSFSAFHARSECERYIQMPGQANGYMLGGIQFKQLRNQTQRDLGPSLFDAGEYHNVITRWGGMGLGDMTRLVATWAAYRRAGCLADASLDGMFGVDILRGEMFSNCHPIVGLGVYRPSAARGAATATAAKRTSRRLSQRREWLSAADLTQPFTKKKKKRGGK
eukprot:TRINITY_DN491_c0_g5_i4.p2 TRINITY_DN491_c0_g5~~TRINITY_DN491_c0_g5_i4.p2  ORF type:complete len:166 (+),score=52.61 TRINITY_DN491_c0_g5_i4:489-986(+)